MSSRQHIRLRTSLVAGSAAALVVLMIGAVRADADPSDSPAVADPTTYVNPMIGTTGGGDVYPGATLPFGMIQWSPVTATGNLYSVSGASGTYSYTNTKVRGFSLTHLNGTGCAGLDSDIPILPFTAPVTSSPSSDTTDATYASSYSHASETAEPGYYRVGLDNGVTTELSVTKRAGSGRFTFPSGSPANLLFRVSNSALGSGDPTNVSIDPAAGTVSGEVSGGGFCGANGVTTNNRSYYHLFFVAHFDRPFASHGTWHDATVSPGSTTASGGEGYPRAARTGKGSGAWVGFDTSSDQTVGMSVGISYVSAANAQANLQQEVPAGTSFDKVRADAHRAWLDELSRIDITPGPNTTSDQITVFYTALYHALLEPTLASDVNGQYEGADDQHGNPGGTRQIDRSRQQAEYDTLSGWDQFRGQVQLLTLLDSRVANDLAQSLLNLATQRGEWDRWLDRSAKTSIMEGDASASVIAGIQAFLSGSHGLGSSGFDLQGAERSLTAAATVPTENDSLDSGDPTIGSGCAIGCPGQRPDLTDYLNMHYVPAQNCHCWGAAGETLEDANADFSVAQLADAVGDTDTYKKFLQRGEYWQNVFDPDFASGTFTGYAWNRNNDGTWATGFSPTSSRGFAEGSTTQYSWMVYDDVAKLTELMGGQGATTTRLDAFFDAFFNGSGSSSLRFDPTNEPDIQTPWMYDYLGVPAKTQSTVRKVVNLRWTNTTGGITGNDDLGTMSAWNVWASLGMWPYAPGRADLVLASPLFPHIVIHRGNGTTITIDAPGAAADTYYVQGLSVNGADSTKPWLPASFVSDGGTLHYTLSSTPSNWGSDPADAPPSLSNPPTLTVAHTLANEDASGPAKVTVSSADTMSGLAGAPACILDAEPLRLAPGPDDGTWQATVTSAGNHHVSCTATNNFGTAAHATDTITVTH